MVHHSFILMPFPPTKLPDVNPTMELKNVAIRRIIGLQTEQKKQVLLLQELQKKTKPHVMQKYVEIRDNTTDTQNYVTPPENKTKVSDCLNVHEKQAVPSTNTLSFNEQVSEIIVLQDKILVDYLRVCNIRLRSHQASVPCNYSKEAADYMSILKALITT
jgi:hypothetical protein